jgi:hypothetical protein
MTLPAMTFSSAVNGAPVGPHDEPATGEPLAEVVVGVAEQAQGDPGRQEGPEGLAGGAGAGELDGAVGQTVRVGLGDLVPEHRADGAVDVADGDRSADRLPVVESRGGPGR